MFSLRLLYEKTSTFFNILALKIAKVDYANDICIRGNIFLKNKSKLYGTIQIGHHVIINSSMRSNPVSGSRTKIYTMKNGKIIIGNNVGLSNCTLISNHQISIGDNVLVGAGTIIIDTNFHSTNYNYRILNLIEEDCDHFRIEIKEGAFIGANCIILKGVSIGKRAVIGAGSVVTKSVPDDEVWAGNPAHCIKQQEGQE